MGNDPKENRSSAPTPEELGAKNVATNQEQSAVVASAVNAAVAAVFAQLGPILQGMAITPEKLREANKPYKDPAQIAREIREMTIWKEDEAENRRLTRMRQDACLHLDDNGRSSIGLIHNYPDRQPRGICAHCQDLIHPREWRIGAPDAKHPRGVPYLVEPHRDYKTVMQLASRT